MENYTQSKQKLKVTKTRKKINKTRKTKKIHEIISLFFEQQ